jgi:uncharacterized membrane protein
MSYEQLVYLHLATVVPAFVIGTYMLANRKGTSTHKRLGRLYLALIAVTAITTLWMPAQVGPHFAGHFGFIHAFSLLALYAVPAAFHYARIGNIRAHRGNMVGLYIGAMLIAGALAFAPGRRLHAWLF